MEFLLLLLFCVFACLFVCFSFLVLPKNKNQIQVAQSETSLGTHLKILENIFKKIHKVC